MPMSREVHLVARPDGLPTEQEFELVETDVPDAAEGEVLVENLYMSVDPAMRPRLTVGYELNEPMAGGAIGRIVQSRVPGISAKLSRQVVSFVQALREQDFYKSPGVAETIDWATALTELDARSLTPQVVGDTLGALLKYQDDIVRMQGDTLQKVLKETTSES